ncbi:MAG TPA: GNAT family N-acetyltransferase [Chitinophagaceae bacterium]|nr:GNAT family N-acetyltransferase [Chitinophagaceae bacterium]
MFRLTRTDSKNEDFRELIDELDEELKSRDGADHPFYAQFNKLDNIKYVIVAYDGDIPVGCGSIKEFSKEAMELKRMYVQPAYRGKGMASRILVELENWAVELKFRSCVLETGKRQPEAVALYNKNGYQRVPNFGAYKNDENSICFEKKLKPDE